MIGDIGVQQSGLEKKRAPAWVSDLIFDNSPLPAGFRRNTWGDIISSLSIASHVDHLVQVSADQDPEITENSNQNQEKSTGFSMEGSEEASRNKSDSQPKSLVPAQNLQKLLDALCVRAMYDYEDETDDGRTYLSFYEGDIIQVPTRLESGLWDGHINGVRGWFSSNYVRVIKTSDDNLEISDEASDEEENGYEESDERESNDENDGQKTDGRAKELYLKDSFWVRWATNNI